MKRGKYVLVHTHLDVVYLLEADDKETLIFREDESNGVKWITFDEVTGDNIVDFIRPVHKRLIKK